MSGIQLDANLLSVEFKPNGFITINGWVWSKFRESRIVNNNSNNYSQSWFWFSSTLPGPVEAILQKAADEAIIDLTSKNALPTFWPAGLTEVKEEYPFDIKIDKFQIFNPNWDKDKMNIATFTISSKHHFAPSTLQESTTTFNLDYKLEQEIFEALEEFL